MSAMKNILITLIVLNLKVEAFFAEKKYNSSQTWSAARHIHLSVPMVVKANNSLFHVLDSRDQKHAIQIESTDFGGCKVPLQLVYPSRHPRRVASLGNGKLIIWLLNYRFTRYKHVGVWVFVVVDPGKCTRRSFEINDQDLDVIDVAAYARTFDVFVRSLSYDQPRDIYVYRYNDEGERVSSVADSIIPDMDSSPFYRPNTIKLHVAKPHDPADGYFQVQMRPNTNTSIVKRLDANFKVTKSLVIKHSELGGWDSGTYSTDHDNFSFCRRRQNWKESRLRCSMFDGLLRQKSSVSLGNETLGDHPPETAHLSVKNSPDGGLLLVFALKVNYRLGTPIYVQRLSAKGDKSEPKIFGRIYCEIYDLHNFEMEEGTYCVVVSCDEIVRTRCMEIE